MLRTEAEAKEVWCPWARALVYAEKGSSGTYNRIALAADVQPLSEVTCCIASKCIAWEWGPKPEELDGFEISYRGRVQEQRKGYCRLVYPQGHPDE